MWHEAYTLEAFNKKYKRQQLENCIAMVNATSSFEVFNNLQPFSMQAAINEEVNYIFMNALNDFIDGDSEVKPTQEQIDFFIEYAYVLITNQVPIDFNVQNVKAVFNEEMFDVLSNIFDNFEGLTARQANNIEFIMSQYSNGDKIIALPGYQTSYQNDEKFSRWGRLELNDDGSYGIEFPEESRNYAKITCKNIDLIQCTGNIILDVVEQP